MGQILSKGDPHYDAYRLQDALERRARREFAAEGLSLAVPTVERAASRRKLAAEGEALPGGRFPIPDRTYLHKAIRAVGRAKGDHAKVRAYIHKRATALGATDMIPAGWKPDGSLTMRARVTGRGRK